MASLAGVRNWNHNVKMVFLFSFTQSLGRGIWMGNVLSAYIFFLASSSNIILGWTSAATGVAFTLTLFPAGIIADRWRRDSLMKVSAFFGLLGVIYLVVAQDIVAIFISLVFWGLAQGTTRPSLESIFADSVPSGDRSGLYSLLHLARNVAMSIGPFINVVLFLYMGDAWELPILKNVMFVGLGFSFISILAQLFFSDDKSLGQVSEALEEKKPEDGRARRKNAIPLLLICSNLIVGAGAGMTIKFFPIFFLQVYSLSPVPVNLILGLTSVFTGLAAIWAQRRSRKQGRVRMIVIVQLSATACLFLIATYPVVFLLIPLFIARGSLMNSAQPLSRSILMDYVPKKDRGKWNSFEALSWGMFWNVSAVAGGYLIDLFSYRVAFLTTASLYVLGTIPLFMLMPMVRRETTSLPDQPPLLYPSPKNESHPASRGFQ